MTASTIIVQPDTHQLRACSAGHRTTGVSNYEGKDFYLSIRRTHQDRPLVTSITAREIGNFVRRTARDLRSYLIIDCCFAAAVQHGFMTSPLGLAELKLHEALPPECASSDLSVDSLPESGAALLAAAGLSTPALAPTNHRLTAFTTALLDVLRNGQTRFGPRLSLEDIHLLVDRRIRELFPDAARPEMRPLQASRGRVELVPLFPNPAFERVQKERKQRADEPARTAEEKHKPDEDTRPTEEKRTADEVARLAEEKRDADVAAQVAKEIWKPDELAKLAKAKFKAKDVARLAENEQKAEEATEAKRGEQERRLAARIYLQSKKNGIYAFILLLTLNILCSIIQTPVMHFFEFALESAAMIILVRFPGLKRRPAPILAEYEQAELAGLYDERVIWIINKPFSKNILALGCAMYLPILIIITSLRGRP